MCNTFIISLILFHFIENDCETRNIYIIIARGRSKDFIGGEGGILKKSQNNS